MKKIFRPAKTFKTTELIELAFENGYTIVCRDAETADKIRAMAFGMERPICEPITFMQFHKGYFRGKEIRGFVIDDADALLQFISTVPVKAIVMTNEPSDSVQLTPGQFANLL